MRNLTLDELDMVAGGEDVETIIIVAHKDDDFIKTHTKEYGDSGPTGDSHGDGGNGKGSTGTTHTTLGHNSWHTDIKLDKDQTLIVDHIVDYGISHGFTDEQISDVVKQAFNETTLGKFESANNPHDGLFQYDATTWNALGHGNLNMYSNDDQIQAMFDDLAKFLVRYNSGVASGSIPASLSFEDYFELKHHGGSNSTDWDSPYIKEYHSHSDKLGFHRNQ